MTLGLYVHATPLRSRNALADFEIWAGSSRGRGNRAAAWFADHLQTIPDVDIQSLVLEGGIKGWVSEKGEYLEYMQEYDASKW